MIENVLIIYIRLWGAAFSQKCQAKPVKLLFTVGCVTSDEKIGFLYN